MIGGRSMSTTFVPEVVTTTIEGEKKIYKVREVEYKEKKGYEARLLSRSTEDSATVTGVLIPWNSCGMTQATILNVATLSYLPYCFFNILSPIMSIVVAVVGYKIRVRN